MSGGIPWITLPAGYLGSSFIGACLIACGFDTNASKIASLVLAVFFIFTLWWARRNLLTWALILGMSGLIVLFWFVAGGEALRYLPGKSIPQMPPPLPISVAASLHKESAAEQKEQAAHFLPVPGSNSATSTTPCMILVTLVAVGTDILALL
ncbi:hypothetical protein H0H92_014340 [Tricholoma furcatifolium]|nr:hypothetical protein H0H92_014340 [Tricholoma furcatifolium]